MQIPEIVPRKLDRVRKHTEQNLNAQFDAQVANNVRFYTDQPKEVISQRIFELEREWDVERVLETNAAILSVCGATLSFSNRRFLAIPLVVTAFLFQHGVQGWCPPLPLFRRLGVRTQNEIDAEKFALKILRGDFDHISADGEAGSKVDLALQSVRELYQSPPSFSKAKYGEEANREVRSRGGLIPNVVDRVRANTSREVNNVWIVCLRITCAYTPTRSQIRPLSGWLNSTENGMSNASCRLMMRCSHCLARFLLSGEIHGGPCCQLA